MRNVYIDVATTGMLPDFDRVVEIAATEVINGKLTGIDFHCYINPDNLHLSPEAKEVNGYGREFLNDKPRFIDIAQALARFFEDAELVCFGADFDLAFLNKEFARMGLVSLNDSSIPVVDLRVLAKSIYPNQHRDLVTLFGKFGLNESNKQLPCLLSNSRRLVPLHQAFLSLIELKPIKELPHQK